MITYKTTDWRKLYVNEWIMKKTSSKLLLLWNWNLLVRYGRKKAFSMYQNTRQLMPENCYFLCFSGNIVICKFGQIKSEIQHFPFDLKEKVNYATLWISRGLLNDVRMSSGFRVSWNYVWIQTGIWLMFSRVLIFKKTQNMTHCWQYNNPMCQSVP